MRQSHLKFFVSVVLWVFSATESYSQTISTTVFSPTFSHLSGRYNTDIQVQLTASTLNQNASMYYTLDGSEPDGNSQLYTGTISIAGDGNYKILKAITISPDNVRSLTSSATYIIDYAFDPNAPYLTNLTWANYTDFIVGDWFGYASTPWTDDYCVRLSILPNGNYIDKSTSGSGFDDSTDIFFPVFYYGITEPSPLKTIVPHDILASGYANGFITIDFGVSTNEDELRYIKFSDDQNMYLEMWHHSTYGPLKYYLTKSPQHTAGIDEQTNSAIAVYPNPASDFLVIKDLDSDVQLLNQLGQSFLIEKDAIMTVSDLPKGFYIITYQNTAGAQVKQKLILE